MEDKERKSQKIIVKPLIRRPRGRSELHGLCCQRNHRFTSCGLSSSPDDPGWVCNGSPDGFACISGVRDVDDTRGMHRWRCSECDLDLCAACFAAYSGFSDADTVVPSCRRGHLMLPLETSRPNGWICSMSHHRGCRNGLTTPNLSRAFDRWRCEVCDYDLCEACAFDPLPEMAAVKEQVSLLHALPPPVQPVRAPEQQMQAPVSHSFPPFQPPLPPPLQAPVQGPASSVLANKTERLDYAEPLMASSASKRMLSRLAASNPLKADFVKLMPSSSEDEDTGHTSLAVADDEDSEQLQMQFGSPRLTPHSLPAHPAENGMAVRMVFDANGGRRVIWFTTKPLGMVYHTNRPIKITGFRPGSVAQRAGVQKGWILTHVGDRRILEMRFRDAQSIILAAVNKLPEKRSS